MAGQILRLPRCGLGNHTLLVRCGRGGYKIRRRFCRGRIYAVDRRHTHAGPSVRVTHYGSGKSSAAIRSSGVRASGAARCGGPALAGTDDARLSRGSLVREMFRVPQDGNR